MSNTSLSGRHEVIKVPHDFGSNIYFDLRGSRETRGSYILAIVSALNDFITRNYYRCPLITYVSIAAEREIETV